MKSNAIKSAIASSSTIISTILPEDSDRTAAFSNALSVAVDKSSCVGGRSTPKSLEHFVRYRFSEVDFFMDCLF